MKEFFKNTVSSIFGTLIAVSLLIFIAGIFVVSIIAVAINSENSKNSSIAIDTPSILHIRLADDISDQRTVTPDIYKLSFNLKMGLRDIISKISQAKTDELITGIYLDLSTIHTGFASLEEIRTALIDFKKSGKFIIAHSESYSHSSYYLASVANKIYLTPEGDVELTGLSSNVMFFKSMFDKIGIEPIVIRHGKFKSAVEPFMQDSISEANREQTQKYIDSLWGTIVDGIAKERNISGKTINNFADNLTITNAKSAVKNKLVDSLKYKDQVFTELKNKSKMDKLNLVPLKNYQLVTDLIPSSSDKIAIIYASGSIVSGKGDDHSIGSETLSKSIRSARKDKNVKAIVLRVNSPGGSALASEVIWRETVLAQKAKPLIVSFGDVAASGGYYIACAADTIVAEPNTITGSIGVFGLFFNTKSLLNEFGVNTSTITTNKYSDIANPMRKLSSFERNVMQIGVKDVYNTFVKHVAEGRNSTYKKIDEIGQGRVWTGKDAIKIGLVDKLGGLEDSIVLAATKAGLTDYNVVSYPKQDKIRAMMIEIFGGVKSMVLKNELGDSYTIYNKIKGISTMSGIQARTPYFFEFNK